MSKNTVAYQMFNSITVAGAVLDFSPTSRLSFKILYMKAPRDEEINRYRGGCQWIEIGMNNVNKYC